MKTAIRLQHQHASHPCASLVVGAQPGADQAHAHRVGGRIFGGRSQAASGATRQAIRNRWCHVMAACYAGPVKGAAVPCTVCACVARLPIDVGHVSTCLRLAQHRARRSQVLCGMAE